MDDPTVQVKEAFSTTYMFKRSKLSMPEFNAKIHARYATYFIFAVQWKPRDVGIYLLGMKRWVLFLAFQGIEQAGSLQITCAGEGSANSALKVALNLLVPLQVSISYH